MILVWCPECGLEKDASEFYVNRRARSGRTTYCKLCTKARNDASKARSAAGAVLITRRPRRSLPQPIGAEKRCNDCGGVFPLDHFPRNKNSRDGRHGYCKPCHNARSRETRERLYGGGRHYHLKRRYGLGADEVAGMIEAQGGMCAICGTRSAEQVDHDHVTGQVRAVLCFTCNLGLGNFGDDPERLRSAVRYLEKFAVDGGSQRDSA